MKRKEIGIAGHIDIGATADCHFEKLVIARIAAGLDTMPNLNNLDRQREPQDERVALVARHMASNFGPKPVS